MGVVEKVRSTLGAYTEDDVRGHLHSDHERILDLVRELTTSPSASARKAYLAELKPILGAHSRAEEASVYAPLMALKKAPDARLLGNEGMVEHHLADTVLRHLLEAPDTSSDLWKANAKVLRELLENHISEEESSVFEQLGHYFSEEELATMAEDFEQGKRKILLRAAAAAAAPKR